MLICCVFHIIIVMRWNKLKALSGSQAKVDYTSGRSFEWRRRWVASMLAQKGSWSMEKGIIYSATAWKANWRMWQDTWHIGPEFRIKRSYCNSFIKSANERQHKIRLLFSCIMLYPSTQGVRLSQLRHTTHLRIACSSPSEADHKCWDGQ
jgi:hypothetical protein